MKQSIALAILSLATSIGVNFSLPQPLIQQAEAARYTHLGGLDMTRYCRAKFAPVDRWQFHAAPVGLFGGLLPGDPWSWRCGNHNLSGKVNREERFKITPSHVCQFQYGHQGSTTAILASPFNAYSWRCWGWR